MLRPVQEGYVPDPFHQVKDVGDPDVGYTEERKSQQPVGENVAFVEKKKNGNRMDLGFLL